MVDLDIDIQRKKLDLFETYFCFNPLTGTGNYSALVPHRIIWSRYTGRWWVGHYI